MIHRESIRREQFREGRSRSGTLPASSRGLLWGDSAGLGYQRGVGGETDTEEYDTLTTGTSMVTPGCAGIATPALDAGTENGHEVDPTTSATLEATAYEADSAYGDWSAGAEFVDGEALVRRAEDGDWATFDGVGLTS